MPNHLDFDFSRPLADQQDVAQAAQNIVDSTTEKQGALLQKTINKGQALEQARQDRVDALEVNRLKESRDVGETITDTAKSLLGKGALSIGEFGFGAADFLSGAAPLPGSGPQIDFSQDFDFNKPIQTAPGIDFSLDKVSAKVNQALGGPGTSISQGFGTARAMIDATLSEKTRFSKGRVSEQLNESQNAQTEANKLRSPEEMKAWKNRIGDIVDTALNTVETYVKNPRALIDEALASAPNLLLAGAAGKGAAVLKEASLVRGMTIADARRRLANPIAQKKIQEAAGQASVKVGAVAEGASNAISAKAEVLNTDLRTLALESPLFNELTITMSPEEARMEVAEQQGEFVMAWATVLGGAASKISGAGDAMGNMFTKNSSMRKNLLGFITAGPKEALEEGLQGASGQIVTNIGKQKLVAKDTETLEGVGEAIGSGIAIGGLSGGVVGGGASLVKGTAAKAKKATDKLDAVIAVKKRNQKAAATVIADAAKTGDFTVAKDSTREDFDIRASVLAVQARNQNEEVTSDQRAKNVAEAQQIIADDFGRVEKLTEAMGKLTDEKEIKVAAKEIKTAQAQQDEAIQLLGRIASGETLSQEDIETSIDDSDAGRVLGSMRINPESVTAEQAETLAADPKITPEQATELKAHATLERAKTGEQVSNDIINGGPGFRGVNQYQQDISSAMAIGDTAKAKQSLTNLTEFATRHSEKARAVTEAFAPFLNNASATLTADQQANLDAVKSKYNLAFKGKYPNRLINALAQEATLLNAAVDLGNIATGTAVSVIEDTTPPVVSEIDDGLEPSPTKPRAKDQVEAPVDLAARVQELGGKVGKPIENALKSGNAKQIKKANKQLKQKVADLEAKQKVDEPTLKEVFEKSAPTLAAAVNTVASEDVNAPSVVTDPLADNVDTTEYNIVTDVTNRVEPEIDFSNVPQENIAEHRFAMTNQITKWFSAKKAKASDVSGNLLATTKDFMGQLARGRNFIIEHLDTTELADGEVSALKAMSGFDKVGQASFLKLFRFKDNRFSKKLNRLVSIKSTDYVQFLADENGVVSKDIVTAINMAALNWLTTRGSDTIFNDGEVVNSLLGFGKDDPVSTEAYDLLQYAGIPRAELMEDIGKAISKTIGLKAQSGAPGNSQAKLDMALGAYAMGMLVDNNYLKLNPVNSVEFYNLSNPDTRPDTAPNARVFASFYAIETQMEIKDDNERRVATDAIQKLSEVMKDSNGLMEKLFDIQSAKTKPSLEQFKTGQVRTVNGNEQEAPSRQAKGLDKHEARGNFIHEEIMGVYQMMGDKAILSIAGYQDNLKETKHAENLKAAEAKNDSIMRELESLDEHLELMSKNEGKPFYMPHSVWSMGRMGMVSNTFNMQASKIHRHFAGHESVKSTVTIGTKDDSVKQFLLAVGEALGVSTDKQTWKQSRADIGILLSSQVIKDGVAAINNIGGETGQDAIDEAITAAVGKHGFHGLDGLVALAAYERAKAKGPGTEFTSTLFREGDGVTNGPTIGTIMLAAAESIEALKKMLNRGGMFFEGETSFGDWLNNPDNSDTYVVIANLWEQAVTNLAGGDPRATAMAAIYGSIVRSSAKSPVTVTVYGSGKDAVARKTSDHFIAQVYATIENAVADGNADALTELNQRLSLIVGGTPLAFTGLVGALEVKLSPKVENNLRAQVELLYGDTLNDTLDEVYGTFKANGKLINKSLGMVWKVFDMLYKNEIAKETASLVEKQELVEGLETLSKDQEKVIRDKLIAVQPIMKTYFSSMEETEEQQLRTGLFVGKYNNVRQKPTDGGKPNNAYYVNVEFATAPSGEGNVKTMRGYGSKVEIGDPGVSPTVMAIQNTDATTMALFIEKFAALNVHDAIIVGQAEMNERIQTMNDGFLEALNGQDIMGSAQAALNRALVGVAKYDKANGTKFSVELGKFAFDKLGKKDKATTTVAGAVRKHMNEMSTTTKKVKKLKEATIADMTLLAQYFVDGAEVKVKDSKPVARPTKVIINQSTNTPKPLGDILGSSQSTIDTESFDASQSIEVNQTSSEQIFDALPETSGVRDTQDHIDYLRNLLSETVNKVLTPFTLHLQESRDTETVGATTPGDMFIINQVVGENDRLSGMLSHGIRMSAQEVYMHEISHIVSRNGIDKGNGLALRELKQLWRLAKDNIKPQDFMNDPDMQFADPAYQAEFDAAQARWDHMFTVRTNEDGSADYLHEFMAFSMTHAKMRNLLAPLSNNTTKVTLLEGNFLEILSKLFTRALDLLGSRLNATRELSADKAMDQLFKQLSGLNARKRSRLEIGASATMDFTNQKLIGAINFTKDKVAKFGELPAIKESRFAFVRATGAVINILATERTEFFADAIRDAAQNVHKGKEGFMGAMVTEVMGRTDNNGSFHDLNRYANKVIDQQRNAISTGVAEILVKEYGANLSETQKVAITKAILKTDLSSLIENGYSIDKLAEFLKGNTELNMEISMVESKLTGKYKHFYRRQAENLGYWMATGQTREHHPLLSATQIANLDGTGIDVTGDVKGATDLIDSLASLYAIKNTTKSYRDSAAELIISEQARGVENGIQFTLAMHTDIKRDAQKRLFVDHDAMIKGYTKEMFNPHIDVQYATEEEGADLESQGYARNLTPLPRDPLDPNQAAIYQYVNPDGGMAKYTAGIISQTAMRAKGASTITTRIQAGDTAPGVNGRLDVAQMTARKQSAIREMFTNRKVTKPLGDNIMFPIIGQFQEVIGYRYMMNEMAKDTLLEKHNGFDAIMGGMAASTVDKVQTEDVNNKVINALKMQYDEDFDTKSAHYVEIGPKSKDKELREIWNLLPEKAKREVRRVWKGETMQVRSDLVVLVFGQRKLSVTDLWKTDPETRNWQTKAFLMAARSLLGRTAASKLSRAEDIWQELVKGIKDIIVIKSIVVTAANTFSNSVFLKMMGVHTRNVMTDQAEGLDGALRWQKDSRELRDLETKLKLGHVVDKQRIGILKNDLHTNPVRNLIEAGVFQTIVEDVEVADSRFSFKSKLDKRLEGFTNRVPEGVKTVAKNMLLTHDTKAYKLLNQSAQLSDFVARYALHKHMTTRADNPLSNEEAIAKVVSIFVNYDLPTHKSLQYGNDMGFIWFSKYNLRIQRVIMESFKENPARVMMILALQGVFGDIPDIYDSAVMGGYDPTNMIRNPFNQAGTLFDIAPIAAVDGAIDVITP